MKGKRIVFIILALLLALTSVSGALAREDKDFKSAKVKSGSPADVFFGRAGVSTPSSVYSGTLELSRLEFDDDHDARKLDLEFHQRWLDVRLFDSDGDAIKQSRGFVYLYFNLTANDREIYADGNLGVYYWDPSKRDWVKALTLLVRDSSSKNGRLATIVNQFGLYALAEEIED